MDLVTAIQVFVFSLFAATVLLFPSAICHDDEHEGEFNYDLLSKKGPLHWGDIRPEWYMCKNGTMQSPIKLQANIATVVTNSGLQTRYQPSNAIIRNSGHEIMIDWTGNAGYIVINGTRYMLEQCHWHSPSEHTINGKRYDLESHMVHISPTGRIAVIGHVYEAGRKTDRFLSMREGDLKRIAQNRDEEIPIGIVNPEQITGMINNKYFRYNGSLTTPPCHENVTWTVFTEAKPVTPNQIKLLRDAVRDERYANARPLQPRNARPMLLYEPRDREEN